MTKKNGMVTAAITISASCRELYFDERSNGWQSKECRT
jgi:hypothetical protein